VTTKRVARFSDNAQTFFNSQKNLVSSSASEATSQPQKVALGVLPQAKINGLSPWVSFTSMAKPSGFFNYFPSPFEVSVQGWEFVKRADDDMRATAK